MNNFEIHNIIFCEQARPEVGGRYTLLGATAPELNVDIPIYDPSAGPPQRPILPISLFITGRAVEKGSFGFELRVNNPDGEKVSGAKLSGDFPLIGVSSIGFGPLPIPVTGAGDYVFEWNFGNDEWKHIASLKLNLIPSKIENAAILIETKTP